MVPKPVFDKLNYTTLSPTLMQLQLADSSVRYPKGIAEDVPVKIRNRFIVGYFNDNRINPQMYGYRSSFHPGVFQGIESTGNVCA